MEPSDAELVRQCLQGDNQGFDSLVRRYQKQILSFCYRTLGDADLAADAAQETFVKAYNALPRFRQDASFLSWAFRIAGNTCTDVARSRARRRSSSLDEVAGLEERAGDEPTPEASALATDSGRGLHRAVLDLPIKQRMPLVLFYFHGMKIREIAESLGQPMGTVQANLHYARESLRRKLEGVRVEK